MKAEELVYALLDSIDTAKEDLPSVRMIRERLGKGSYGTISAALRNWKKSHGFAEAVRHDSAIDLDEGTLREFAESVSKVFGPIIRSRVASVRQENEKRIAELSEALNAASERLQKEIHKREVLEEEVDRLRKELDEERLAKARAEGALEAVTRGTLVAGERS